MSMRQIDINRGASNSARNMMKTASANTFSTLTSRDKTVGSFRPQYIDNRVKIKWIQDSTTNLENSPVKINCK